MAGATPCPGAADRGGVVRALELGRHLVPQGGGPVPQLRVAAARAWSRSATRSWAFSIPTLRRRSRSLSP